MLSTARNLIVMLPRSTEATTAAPDDQPPPLAQSTNEIALVSTEHSKITNVSVYSGRAEITRLFTFSVRTGQNRVTITGLPNVLDQDSLRIEGCGAATIHDVAISRTPRPAPASTASAELTSLHAKKARTNKALARARKAISALEAYLGTLHTQHVAAGQIAEAVEEYEATAAGTIAEQRKADSGGMQNAMLGMRAVVGVFAEMEGEVEIALIYAVDGALWNAKYDIRVDMQAKEEQVTLIYKAAISQSTGEDWKDVRLTLDTATPTFGVSVPTLNPWPLSIYKPAPALYGAGFVPPPPGGPPPPAPSAPMSRAFKMRRSYSEHSDHCSYDETPPPPPPPRVGHRTLEVSSKGNVSATFEVPGLITIPSDGAAHNVTIVQLRLGAKMSWVCVPKKGTKVHLSAKIKNASRYTLLRGNGSVYVDGSFISRSEVPAVSPDESFDCPLGLDPSVRVTYHPQTKKQSQSGFMTKTATHVFAQHITVHNTKNVPVEGVKVLDQIPVSEDAQIQVNLRQPAAVTSPRIHLLPLLGLHFDGRGVVASWAGADGENDGASGEEEQSAVGRDGKIAWVCQVPPQGKVELALKWEVVVPTKTDVLRLMLVTLYRMLPQSFEGRNLSRPELAISKGQSLNCDRPSASPTNPGS
ncbi:putative mucoidy inhibitor A [Lyophyllum shimeji]|uniref:Mucoidy inhibitor A n=1 Tax=Lyophyllum shimeji TaxID=47721 RepID=A0A9P3UUN2_LYOSH|nr:putative mucoidy inhibitor A [Lyophyllum shimeji]